MSQHLIVTGFLPQPQVIPLPMSQVFMPPPLPTLRPVTGAWKGADDHAETSFGSMSLSSGDSSGASVSCDHHGQLSVASCHAHGGGSRVLLPRIAVPPSLCLTPATSPGVLADEALAVDLEHSDANHDAFGDESPDTLSPTWCPGWWVAFGFASRMDAGAEPVSPRGQAVACVPSFFDDDCSEEGLRGDEALVKPQRQACHDAFRDESPDTLSPTWCPAWCVTFARRRDAGAEPVSPRGQVLPLMPDATHRGSGDASSTAAGGLPAPLGVHLPLSCAGSFASFGSTGVASAQGQSSPGDPWLSSPASRSVDSFSEELCDLPLAAAADDAFGFGADEGASSPDTLSPSWCPGLCVGFANRLDAGAAPVSPLGQAIACIHARCTDT